MLFDCDDGTRFHAVPLLQYNVNKAFTDSCDDIAVRAKVTK